MSRHLRSLPPSYGGIVSALDSRADDEISMDMVKSRLMDEFYRRMERDGFSGKPDKAMQCTQPKVSLLKNLEFVIFVNALVVFGEIAENI